MGPRVSKPAGPPPPVYIPANPPPPRRQEDDYPVVDATGIGKGMAQGCQSEGGGACQLVVPNGLSSSGAKLYRTEGTIRRDQCRRYATDLKKVANNEKAFEEVKKDLIAGLYYEELDNGYCRQIMYDAEDLKAVRDPANLPTEKARYTAIRAMSDSGGYSSVTKLFIKPTIPFEVEFNGKPHKITVLTLLHPSPIRVENIQHDAMLTLGDPGKGNNDGLVILIPLQGAITAGASGSFLNKVVRYMSSVLQPDPATGDYKTIDIPTGSDWDISKLFPGSPGEGGKTVVTDVGYYVWEGYPPLELRATGNPTPSTTRSWFSNWYIREPGVQRYSWQPMREGSVRYLMLSKPALVSSMDLQTIRMLPATPTTEALAPIMKWTLSYRTAETCSAPSTASSSAATTIAGFFPGGRETMENPQCDPFAPGAFAPPDHTDSFATVIIAIFTTLAVGLAIYLAVLFFTKTKWGQWAAHQGTLAGNYVSQAFVTDRRILLPADKRFEVSSDMEEADRKAEARLNRIETRENPLAKKRTSARAETAAPTRLDDTVVQPKLPPAGTPAAAAVEKAGEDAAAALPPASLAAPVTGDVLPTSGPAAAAIEQAGEEVRRADVYRQRAKEAEAKLKADAAEAAARDAAKKAAEKEAEEAAKKEAEKEAAAAAEAAAKKEAEKPLTQSERAKIAEVVERRDAEGKVPEDFDAEAELGRPLSDEQAKKAADHAAMIASTLPEESKEDREARVNAQTQETLRAAFKRGEEARATLKETEPATAAPRRVRKVPVAPPKAPSTRIADAVKANEDAEIKRRSEDAAASASKAAERQLERQRKTESPRPTAAAPAPEAARPPRGHPPPTADEIQSVVGDIAESTKIAKAAGRALPNAPKSTLSESETKQAKDKLTKLRDDALDVLASAVRSVNLRRSLWKNRSEWMRFEEETKHYKQFLGPLVKKVVAYRDAIEASGLDGLPRLGYANALTELTVKTLRLLEESKRRMNSLKEDAPPPIFSGGRRRMKRKSTRRYVA